MIPQELAEAVAADGNRSVVSVRWCLQSILSGGPITMRTPMIAQRLIEAAQFSCTATTFDEHGARETWEKLMDEGIADLVGFYEYSDGVGGSSGDGRVRFVGRYPISFLQEQFTSVVLSEGNATEREELLECLMTIFDGTGILGSEEITIFVDAAHSMCADDEDAYGYGTTSQEFDRLTQAMRKHNITWGSKILGPQESMFPPVSKAAVPGRRLLVGSSSPCARHQVPPSPLSLILQSYSPTHHHHYHNHHHGSSVATCIIVIVIVILILIILTTNILILSHPRPSPPPHHHHHHQQQQHYQPPLPLSAPASAAPASCLSQPLKQVPSLAQAYDLSCRCDEIDRVTLLTAPSVPACPPPPLSYWSPCLYLSASLRSSPKGPVLEYWLEVDVCLSSGRNLYPLGQ